MPIEVLVRQFGGPEVLSHESVVAQVPGPGEALVQQTAVGLNFIDVYERTGLYANPLPTGLGHEAAGTVVAIGRGVRQVKPGDRVAYAITTPGAYADARIVKADRLVPVPEGVSDRLAAAALLKGMTAQVLLRRTYRVSKGTVAVIHAAAGGVGAIAAQWARHLGAIVIGVVGSEAKTEFARTHGCNEVLVLGRDELAASVKKLTRGRGADVVYDSVGKDTFFASLDALAPLGMMVTYGNSSGAVPPVAPLELARRGSLFLTRPVLFTYIAERSALLRSARDVFEVIGKGVVRIEVGQTYALRDVAQAHRDLEARRTVGSTVLLP